MAGMTEAQRKALAAARERRAEAAETQAAAPRERVRAAAQGLTLGAADEIEAAARSAYSNTPYQGTLDEIRGSLKGYQEAYPLEALGYEVGGAVLPAAGAMLLAPFTGGTSAAAVAPTLGRLAAVSALQGGISAFNTGEGGFKARALRVPLGVAGGAVGGVAAGGAMRVAGAAINKLTDAARRLIGNRGSTVVENEIQRLVRQTGKTADQIAADILDGRILAENESIKAAVRAYRAGGGEASTVITQGMTARPAMTRAEAMRVMRSNLSDENAPSALQAQRRDAAVAAEAESAAYRPFNDIPASVQVTQELGEALRRVPSAAEEIAITLRAETGQAPFYQIMEDGSVRFTRQPTITEAETVRRAIGNRASALFRGSMGGAGAAVEGVQKNLRSSLDEAMPELGAVRATAASSRAQNDAFTAGSKALSGDVYEKLFEFGKLTDPAVIDAYRAGFMSALERTAATGSRNSLIRNLTKADAKEGMLLEAVLPPDAVDEVLNRLRIASASQEATGYVLGGSPTADTMMEASRRGMGVSASSAVGALSGDMGALVSVASDVLSRLTRDLTDAERARVARILVSDDPELVRRAIVDESGMAALQQRVQQLMAGMTRGARRAGSNVGASYGGDASQEIGQGLLAQ
jgi:hypothetical protein